MSPIDEQAIQATDAPAEPTTSRQRCCNPRAERLIVSTVRTIRLPRRCRQDTAEQVISRDPVRNKLLPAHPNGAAPEAPVSPCGRQTTAPHPYSALCLTDLHL
jgi:hypothetical protein